MHYISTNKEVLSVEEVNNLELFHLPTYFNKNIEKFSVYGQQSVADMVDECKDSGHDNIVRQLNDNERRFVYVAKEHTPTLFDTSEYKIYVNMHKDCSKRDILKSYMFCLKFDSLYQNFTDDGVGGSKSEKIDK